MGNKQYYVYILTNATRTLYVGVINNLERRIWEHKNKAVDGFTSKYNVNWLVWFAETNDVREAIATEKKIKGWVRAKKVALIEEMNPQWRDLSLDWYADDATTT
jgi:putative endonuclease